MKKTYTKALGVEELAALPDEDVDTRDIPELDEAFWSKARVVMPQAKPTDTKKPAALRASGMSAFVGHHRK